MIRFYLPGLITSYVNFNLAFAQYLKTYPEYVVDDVQIGAFYGCFQGSVWNGGRITKDVPVTTQDIQNIIKAINEQNVAVRYTFTNSQLEKKHLTDEFCNYEMWVANNGQNEVLVHSGTLENYLRTVYPNFKYCKSTTACLKSIDEINQATKRYDMVVIDYSINKDLELLKQIKDKDRIEILVDEICPCNCSARKQHYELISKANLSNEKLPGCIRNQQRPFNLYKLLEENKDSDLTFEEIYNTYVPMGFKNFKLVGRNIDPFFTFESYIYYMIKPEYRDIVRQDILFSFLQDYIPDSIRRQTN